MGGAVVSRYKDRYPRAGDVALLCEGDIAGYELDLLAKWTAARTQPRGVFVDIWPCGTGHGLYSMADAVGRARPIVVIEDRDFRAPALAAKECDDKKGKRTQRGAQVLTWRTWKRHEIENYLLEPEVLFPVMAHGFGIDEARVEQRLASLLLGLAPCQAAQCALYSIRHPLTADLAGRIPGIPRKQAQPLWDPTQGRFVAPTIEDVEQALRSAIERAMPTLQGVATGANVEATIATFREKHKEWTGMQLGRSEWRQDWAGKETLGCLRQSLATEFGWFDPQDGQRKPVEWDELPATERARVDREIEWALQPHLVARFLERVGTDQLQEPWTSIRAEWGEVSSACLLPPEQNQDRKLVLS